MRRLSCIFLGKTTFGLDEQPKKYFEGSSLVRCLKEVQLLIFGMDSLRGLTRCYRTRIDAYSNSDGIFTATDSAPYIEYCHHDKRDHLPSKRAHYIVQRDVGGASCIDRRSRKISLVANRDERFVRAIRCHAPFFLHLDHGLLKYDPRKSQDIVVLVGSEDD